MEYLININEFCQKMLRHGRKEDTVTVYHSMLKISFELLYEAGMETEPSMIGEEEIYFLKKNLGKSERTTKQYIKILNLLLKDNGNNVIDGMHLLWNRDADNRIFITWNDFAVLYRHADAPERMVLLLGAMMGLRRIEISKIRLSDIHRTSITVHGKGHGDDGLVIDQPMPQEVRDELARYLAWRRTVADPGCDRLIVWTSYRDDSVCERKRQEELLRDRMVRLSDETGIRFTPHSLRRLYACSLYQIKVDLLTIRDLMRHSDISTTQRYLTHDQNRLDKAVEGLGKTLGGVLNI